MRQPVRTRSLRWFALIAAVVLAWPIIEYCIGLWRWTSPGTYELEYDRYQSKLVGVFQHPCSRRVVLEASGYPNVSLLLGQASATCTELANQTNVGSLTAQKDRVICEDSFGWPLKAFRCEWRYNEPKAKYFRWTRTAGGARTYWNRDSATGSRTTPILHGGLSMEPWTDKDPALRWLIVPLTPIWSGVLLNSLCFVLAVLCVGEGSFIAARAHMRFRRRKRGLCEACGYDLRGIGGTLCPECGLVLPK